MRVAATVRSVPLPPTCRPPRRRKRTPASAVAAARRRAALPGRLRADARAGAAARGGDARCPSCRSMPPPFTPADEPESDVSRRRRTTSRTRSQESDAHELPVPLPVSNYRLPDPRVLARGTRPTGKDVDVERVGASLLAALTEHGVEARLIGTVSGPRVTRYELQLARGHEGLARHGAARRPRLRARHDRDPHPRADPRQAGGRRRGAQPLAEPRLARRSRRRARDRLAADGLARQGHLRPDGGRRPRARCRTC